MSVKTLTQIYMLAVASISIISLAYVYLFPPPSMFTTRENVPHFSPKIAHPETGKPIALDTLIRHYRGD